MSIKELKSKNILKKIFFLLKTERFLSLILYNKVLMNKLLITINDYKTINELKIKINEKRDKNKNKKAETYKRNRDSLLSITKSKQSKKLSIIDKTNLEEIIYSHDHYHNENILKYIKQKELKEIDQQYSKCSEVIDKFIDGGIDKVLMM